MCVVMIASKTRPTELMVERAFNANDHGGGVAWRDKDKAGHAVVRWQKGLDLAGMQELVKSLPMPFIAHFRIASVGGRSAALTHPFPIENNVDLALEGQIKGYVLFHNGHWGEWKSFTKETALKKGARIPIGSWSDSRAMAWAAHNYGLGILELIDEKAVAFGPGDLEVIRGTGWDDVDGVWCSNKHWNHGGTSYRTNDHRHHGGMGTFFNRGGLEAAQERDDYWKRRQKESETKKSDKGPGGDLTKIPFDQIEKMWEAQQSVPRGEWKISKKQFKRLKRAHEKKVLNASKRALVPYVKTNDPTLTLH